MLRKKLRRHLSMPGLLATSREPFNAVSDPTRSRGSALADCLSRGLAILPIKCLSLLRFNRTMRNRDDTLEAEKLNSLFGVEAVPSDTGLRARLDQLHRCFTDLFKQFQRGKGLDSVTVLGDHLLLSVGRTGCFSSKAVECKHCLTKNHRDCTVTYRHRMPCGAFVHPKVKTVIPLASETVDRKDGTGRNDCGQGAAIRFINDFRWEHPHPETIFVQDGLSSNGPHIKRLRAKNLRLVLGAKPGDRKFLTDRAKRHAGQAETLEIREGSVRVVTLHRFRRLTEVPTGDTHFREKVTFPDCSEMKLGGRTRRWSRVTDLEVSAGNAMQVM